MLINSLLTSWAMLDCRLAADGLSVGSSPSRSSLGGIIIDGGQVLILFCWFSMVFHWGVKVRLGNDCGSRLIREKMIIVKSPRFVV